MIDFTSLERKIKTYAGANGSKFLLCVYAAAVTSL